MNIQSVYLLTLLSLGLSSCGSSSSGGSEPVDRFVAPNLTITDDKLPAEMIPAIIIGSGFGGSVSALRLGEAGISTVVLERGRWWTVKDPTDESGTFATLDTVMAPGGDGRSSWITDECVGNVYLTFLPPVKCPVSTGILEFTTQEVNPYSLSVPFRSEGISTVTAAGVGGGSLVYNGVTYLPNKSGWDAAFPPSTLPYMQNIWQELNDKGYFQQALDNLAAEEIPADLLAQPVDGSPDYYESSRDQRDSSILAGFPLDENAPGYETHGTGSVIVTYDWDKVREELTGERARSVLLGEIWWGTNSDAKKTLDKKEGYLGRAIATGNVEVRALHEVDRIRYDVSEQLYLVDVIQHSENYQQHERLRFKTPNLIMSAGSVGSTKLLTRAKGKGDLPNLNEYVGTTWTTNGNLFAFRRVESANETVLQGGPAGFKTVVYDNPASPLVIENLAHRAPEIFSEQGLLENMMKLNFTIAVGIPQGFGTFEYVEEDDSVTLHWPDDADTNVLESFKDVFNKLAAQTDGLLLENAQDGTVHPLGGVPLGKATDLFCRLYNYNGLYAIDGSVLPGPGALTNPSLLITAMAERCLDEVVPEMKCRIDGC